MWLSPPQIEIDVGFSIKLARWESELCPQLEIKAWAGDLALGKRRKLERAGEGGVSELEWELKWLMTFDLSKGEFMCGKSGEKIQSKMVMY